MSNIPQVGLNNSCVLFQKKNKTQNNTTSEINTHEKKGKEAKAKFDSIMEWRLDAWQRQGKSWTTEEMLENYSKYDSLDYDLILSTIQSLAKGIK